MSLLYLYGIISDTQVGTEELAHLEIIGSIVSQLTSGEGAKSFDKYGVGDYYVDHSNAVYPQNAAGAPFTSAYLASKGDPIADLVEDLAAEGTTAKEQSVSSTPKKALFYVGFLNFTVEIPNRRLRPHKNNKLHKYDMTRCFKKKYKGKYLQMSFAFHRYFPFIAVIHS